MSAAEKRETRWGTHGAFDSLPGYNVNTFSYTSFVRIKCHVMPKKNAANNRLHASKGRLKSLERIDTMYYPGFPTDLQTQIMALQTISRGTSVIAENIFETRFKTVPQLIKMGADITVRDRTAVVRGVPGLHGAQVHATDLRGGASLVLAGLAAEGRTEVKDIYHIDRGYEDMAPILSELGANIIRVV